jgi:hypothetical protein
LRITARVAAFDDLIAAHTGSIHLKATFAGYFIRYFKADAKA